MITLTINELLDKFENSISNPEEYKLVREEMERRLKASIPTINAINSLSKDLHKSFKSMRIKGINLNIIATRVQDESLKVVSKELYKDVNNQEEILSNIDKILQERINSIK